MVAEGAVVVMMITMVFGEPIESTNDIPKLARRVSRQVFGFFVKDFLL